MKTTNVSFNLHTFHNPHCDILEYQLTPDMKVCYGIYVKESINRSGKGVYNGRGHWVIPVGAEFLEVYVGENYNINSNKRSYSRCYYFGTDRAPKIHMKLWEELKAYYNKCKADGTYEFILKEGRDHVKA